MTARIIALLWAAFWLFFFIAESLAWDTAVGVMSAWAAVGLVFVILALIPLRWEMAGGVLLLIAALCIGAAYAVWSPAGLSATSRIITILAFSVPPLLAGILFLLHHHRIAV